MAIPDAARRSVRLDRGGKAEIVENAEFPPIVPELVHASLVAAALVHGAGVLLLTGCGLIGVHIGS